MSTEQTPNPPAPKYEFKAKGFQLSTNYKNLWDLIMQGARVPAWVLYSEKYAPELIWDLVEIKYIEKFNNYSIGTRGMSYSGLEGYEEFEETCIHYSIHFVVPMIPSDFNQDHN